MNSLTSGFKTHALLVVDRSNFAPDGPTSRLAVEPGERDALFLPDILEDLDTGANLVPEVVRKAIICLLALEAEVLCANTYTHV